MSPEDHWAHQAKIADLKAKAEQKMADLVAARMAGADKWQLDILNSNYWWAVMAVKTAEKSYREERWK